ncbi:MAG: hypothetical protein WC710_08190 [Gallionella sp.]|jgi:hypothetical protein
MAAVFSGKFSRRTDKESVDIAALATQARASNIVVDKTAHSSGS